MCSDHDSTVLIHSLDHPNGLRVLEGLHKMLHTLLVAEFLLLVVAEFLLSSREDDTRS